MLHDLVSEIVLSDPYFFPCHLQDKLTHLLRLASHLEINHGLFGSFDFIAMSDDSIVGKSAVINGLREFQQLLTNHYGYIPSIDESGSVCRKN